MKITSIKNLVTIAFCILSSQLLFISSAKADLESYHGTECMTANLEQGELFTWNKDGITNNSSISLFVICPMTFNVDVVNSFASPRGSIRVIGFIGPANPNGTSMDCLVRYFTATETNGAEPNDDHNLIQNVPVTGISKNLGGGVGGDIDRADSALFNIAKGSASSILPSAHLLCLIPPGSTLMTYNFATFE